MGISKLQIDFLDCVKPLIKTLPESKKMVSDNTGVPVNVITNFINSKSTISQQHFESLFEYFNCTYELLKWDDGHTANDFRLNGGYTTIPSTKKEIVDLYSANSHGGDLVFAHELVHENGYHRRHTRYILLHTCYHLYTLMILKDVSDPLDILIAQDRLINFGGARAISEDFMTELTQHEFEIIGNPGSRRELDQRFFDNKDLVFSMIPLASIV